MLILIFLLLLLDTIGEMVLGFVLMLGVPHPTWSERSTSNVVGIIDAPQRYIHGIVDYGEVVILAGGSKPELKPMAHLAQPYRKLFRGPWTRWSWFGSRCRRHQRVQNLRENTMDMVRYLGWMDLENVHPHCGPFFFLLIRLNYSLYILDSEDATFYYNNNFYDPGLF